MPCLKEVSPLAHPANAASRRVLQKAGIKIARFAPEMNRALYRRRRQKLPAVALAPTRVEAVGPLAAIHPRSLPFAWPGPESQLRRRDPGVGEGRGTARIVSFTLRSFRRNVRYVAEIARPSVPSGATRTMVFSCMVDTNRPIETEIPVKVVICRHRSSEPWTRGQPIQRSVARCCMT